MLLCTDGYWSAVEPFGLVASASELVEETAARGARQIVDAIRDAERRDPEARAYPRVDTADDASVVCLRR
jgi:hypothetical protein